MEGKRRGPRTDFCSSYSLKGKQNHLFSLPHGKEDRPISRASPAGSPTRLLPLTAGSGEPLPTPQAGLAAARGTAVRGPAHLPPLTRQPEYHPSLRDLAWWHPEASVHLCLPSHGSPGAPHVPKSSMCLNVVGTASWQSFNCEVSGNHLYYQC